jgi:hypothetical protein
VSIEVGSHAVTVQLCGPIVKVHGPLCVRWADGCVQPLASVRIHGQRCRLLAMLAVETTGLDRAAACWRCLMTWAKRPVLRRWPICPMPRRHRCCRAWKRVRTSTTGCCHGAIVLDVAGASGFSRPWPTLPLALELAGRMGRRMGLPAALAALRDNLGALVSDEPDRPLRQRSLDAAFAGVLASLPPRLRGAMRLPIWPSAP